MRTLAIYLSIILGLYLVFLVAVSVPRDRTCEGVMFGGYKH